MTPLERAARALYQFQPQTEDVFRRDCANPSALPQHSLRDLQWEKVNDVTREHYLTRARAVLQAIREPSERMDNAGMAEADKTSHGIVVTPIWQAMIDAALEEG